MVMAVEGMGGGDGGSSGEGGDRGLGDGRLMVVEG